MENCYLKMRDGEKIFIQYWHNHESNVNLLYVHGGPGRGCWDFEYDAQKLSETCNVIMYDQRGVLRSNAITDSFSSELLIDDIEDIRKYFNINKFVLCGHSYGGHLILRYTLKYPENVEKLIYVCPSFDFQSSIKNVYRLSFEYLRELNDFDRIRALTESIGDASPKSYFAHLSNIPETIREKVYYVNQIPRKVENVIYNNSISDSDWRKGVEQQQKIFDEKEIYINYNPFLMKISIPSLLIVGDHDPICCKVQKESFSKNPNNTIITIKNAGHSLYLENPDEFICEVTKYLNSI